MNKDCLLWVTSWGIWASSENWHLYYRLRRSYGDERLIEEAPGHLFGASNVPDLVTFVEIGLIAGWDMYLIPTIGQGRVFVSHDEWIEIAMDFAVLMNEFEAIYYLPHNGTEEERP